MTSNYQDVRDDARNSRDILAHRSKLASAPTGTLPDVVRYTIRPTLSVNTDADEGLPIILTFDGEDLIRFDDPRHAMNALLTLSVVPFIGTEDATTALLDSDTAPYAFRGENRTDAVRAAALWSAEYGRPNDVPQFHILWDDAPSTTEPDHGTDADGNEACEVGDIVATEGTDLAICIPDGRWWDLTEDDARTLSRSLTEILSVPSTGDAA